MPNHNIHYHLYIEENCKLNKMSKHFGDCGDNSMWAAICLDRLGRAEKNGEERGEKREIDRGEGGGERGRERERERGGKNTKLVTYSIVK